MKVKINGTEYEVKYTIRALFIFEQITEKSFSLDSTLDNYIFFYSMILANNNGEKPLSWDDFIEAIDTDPSLTSQLLGYITEYHASRRLLDHSEDPDGDKSEKKN